MEDGATPAPYQAPRITCDRQRKALKAVAAIEDLTAEELRHAIIFAENITPDGGIDLDNLPHDTKLHFAPIVADWLKRQEG